MRKRYTKILKGFVARDENGTIFFYPGVPPKRGKGIWLGDYFPEWDFSGSEDLFVDLTWKDEPREAILTMHWDLELK